MIVKRLINNVLNRCINVFVAFFIFSTVLYLCSQFYQFTLFAMSLNEMEPGMEKKLCPTDCRYNNNVYSFILSFVNLCTSFLE